MLFFIDETWQEVGGQKIGALGAVAIPTSRYNAYCRDVFALKKTLLDATEFTDSELKGQNCFTKAAFKRELLHGDSYWLESAREFFRVLGKHRAQTFAIWTRNAALLDLRHPDSRELGKPYKQLLFDLRAFMRNEGRKHELGALNFDERAHREDEATARALTNYLAMSSAGNRWLDHFLLVPSFTASSISPGLQAADVVSYLAAHCADRTARPELAPFMREVERLWYSYDRGKKRVNCMRQVL